MLGDQDQSLETAGPHGTHDLTGVKLSWVEDGRVGIAITPFLVFEGRGGEMYQHVHLFFMPLQLPFGRQDTIGLGRLHLGRHGSRQRKQGEDGKSELHICLD